MLSWNLWHGCGGRHPFHRHGRPWYLEQANLPPGARLLPALRCANGGFKSREQRRSVTEPVHRATLHETLCHPPVHHGPVYGLTERVQVREPAARLSGSRQDDAANRPLPCILHRAQAEPHGCGPVLAGLHRELQLARVDIGWQHRDAGPPALHHVKDDLLGIADVRRQQGRHEFDRVVCLEVRGLGGDHGVGRAVGFIEPIAGEPLDHVENLATERLGQAMLDATGHEPVAILRHLLGQLLAHRLPEAVALRHGEPSQDIRYPDHLLLVERDPVRFLKDCLHLWVHVLDRRAAMFSGDVVWRHLHWPGPDQRHQGNQILEAVGRDIDRHPGRHAAFKLEHTNRLAPAQQFIALRIIKR